MLDPVALAWASWAGVVLGVAGLLVSGIGLWLTFREARKASTAAELAAREVAKVVAMTRSRAGLSALSSAVSQADVIRLRIDKDALRGSGEAFTAFRRSVNEAVSTMVVSGTAVPVAEVDAIDRALAEIGRLINSSDDTKARKARMRAALETVASFLISHEARMKTEDLT